MSASLTEEQQASVNQARYLLNSGQIGMTRDRRLIESLVGLVDQLTGTGPAAEPEKVAARVTEAPKGKRRFGRGKPEDND